MKKYPRHFSTGIGRAVILLMLITNIIGGTFTGIDIQSSGRTFSNYNHRESGSYYGNSYQDYYNSKGSLPILIYRFLEQSMSRGCSVSMKCIATGTPTPTIKWLMDGFSPPHSERFMIGQYVTLNGDVISHFNVTACSSDDSSEISCSATNSLGTVSHKSRLNIFGPPFVREFGRIEPGVSGQDYSIKCPVGGYPIDEITWYRDDKLLPVMSRQSTSRDGILTIKNVQKSDIGDYVCQAKYKDLMHSNKIHINVVVPPKVNYFRPETIVEEGSRVVKYCEATGDGPLTLEWEYNGLILDPTKTVSDVTVQQIGIDIAVVLVITEVSQSLSRANFTCIARNQVGQDRLTTTLIVQVSPRLTKFTFPDEVYEGMRVSVHCSVNNYPEEDVTFQWLKDGKVIGNLESSIIGVARLDPFSSILSLESVSWANSGSYTCLAFNSHGNSSVTAQLTVLVPPKWTKEPSDIISIEGETVVIRCEAEGYPSPTVVWKKAAPSGGSSSGRLSGTYVDIPLHHQAVSGSSMLSFPNGTLLIPNSIARTEGGSRTYRLICEVDNGIGSGLSKLIHLRVNVPVKIQAVRNGTARGGSSTIFRCLAEGDFPIRVKWFHGTEEVIPLLNPRYQVKTVNTTTGVSSELSINSVRWEDEGRALICSAQNLCDPNSPHVQSLCKIDQAEMWLRVLEPPDMPKNVTILLKGSRFVELGWKVPIRSDHSRMSVKLKIEGGTWNTYGDDFNTSTAFVNDLKPGTSYHFLVVAHNMIGTADSEELTVRTHEEPPDQSPRNVHITPLSSREIKLEWDALTWSNGVILGYHIGIRTLSDDGNYQFATIESPASQIVMPKLSPFTRYELVVRAYNIMGQGPLSKPLTVTTLETTPLAPKGISCYALTSTKLEVSWKDMSADESRGILNGFRVYIQRADMDFLYNDESLVANTSDSRLVIGNLGKYVMYEVQVRGFTSKGDGELSNSIYCQTEEDIPGPPENVKVIRIDSERSVISWNPPIQSVLNGQLTHYMVYLPNGSGRLLPPNVTKTEIKLRFQPFVAYVSASTRIGEGGNATIRVHPDGNTGSSAMVSSGRSIQLLIRSDVTLQCETVLGKSPRSWFHQSKLIIESERKFSEDGGSTLRLRNAHIEDSGNYSCFLPVFTWEGITFKSERISYFVNVVGPPLPPRIREHEIGINWITFNWEIGRLGVEGYFLQFKIQDEWLERKLPRRLSTYTLRDLSCGTTYPIYLTAYNKAGISKPSLMLNLTTLGEKPRLAATPIESGTELNRTWISILLNEIFKDGGCPILAYRVWFRKKAADFHWKSVDEDLDRGKRNVNLIGLEESTQYQVKVRAENEAGNTEITFSISTLGSLSLIASSDPPDNLLRSMTNSFTLRIIGPILLGCAVVLIFIAGICLIFKRKLLPGHSELEEGTGDTFTYLKQNCGQVTRQNEPEVYMTLKKVSTTVKNRIPPHSLDDGVVPYATFELKEPRHQRRRIGGYPVSHSRQDDATESEVNSYYMSKDPHHIRHMCNNTRTAPVLPGLKTDDEDEEYESIGSDSDSPDKAGRDSHFGIYDVGGRLSNRYESALPKSNKPKEFQGSNPNYRQHSSRRKRRRTCDVIGNPNSIGDGTLIHCDSRLGDVNDLYQIKV